MSSPLYVVVGNRGFEPSDTDGAVPWLWDSEEGAKLKADHLNKFEITEEYYAGTVFIVRKEWVEAVQARADELDRLRAENERLADALLDATAHLTAAASAYQHYAKRHRSLGAPPADALFSTRSKDFDRAAKRARAAIAKEAGE